LSCDEEVIEKFVAWDSMKREKQRLLALQKRDPEAVPHLEKRIKALQSAMDNL